MRAHKKKPEHQIYLDRIYKKCKQVEMNNCLVFITQDKKRIPQAFAPNIAKPGSPKEIQNARRVIWQLETGMPIPDGHRVYSTCRTKNCLNKSHMFCCSHPEWGKYVISSGRFKGSPKKIISARLAAQQRCSVTAENVKEILASNEQGCTIARRLNVLPQVVNRVRMGKLLCYQPLGGIFSSLGL